MQNESIGSIPRRNRLRANLPSLFLSAIGAIILAWVAYLIWYDMTWWDKDITLIFFGSRTGELISLGIGMKVIYYFLIGLSLLSLGLLMGALRRGQAARAGPDQWLAHAHADLIAQRQKRKDISPSLIRRKSNESEEISGRFLTAQTQKQQAGPSTSVRKKNAYAEASSDHPLVAQRQKKKDNFNCPRGFGYLSKRPKDAPIPQECLTCLKLPKCMSQI